MMCFQSIWILYDIYDASLGKYLFVSILNLYISSTGSISFAIVYIVLSHTFIVTTAFTAESLTGIFSELTFRHVWFIV